MHDINSQSKGTCDSLKVYQKIRAAWVLNFKCDKKLEYDERHTPVFKNFYAPLNPHLPALGFWMYPYRRGHFSIFGQNCWRKSRFLHFLCFFAYFHSALPNMAVFACFRPIFAIRNDHEHHRGWIWVNSRLYIFWVFALFAVFGHFWAFFAFCGFQWGLGGFWECYRVIRQLEGLSW